MALNWSFKNITRESGNWRVVVNPRPGSDEVEVWLLNMVSGRPSLANINKSGFLELKELNDADPDNTPLIRVSSMVWQLLVDAITETTPPTKKEVVEGILDATRAHLEDMRSLVFKKGKKDVKTD